VQRSCRGRKQLYRASKDNDVVVSSPQRDISVEIVESCRRGDREALRTIYCTYKDKVYSMALYAFHGDTAAASDVTQEVFLKLMRTIAQYRGDSRFSTWLYRLVINACLDRKRRADARPVVSDPAVLDTLAAPGSQEDDLARREMGRAVRVAVSALPVKLRLAILLRYFADLSYEDMAKTLNCSTGTVGSRLNRAHQMLLERLGHVAKAR
jgi:RNA polymerase sigma-70 factor (ECF subfamily)